MHPDPQLPSLTEGRISHTHEAPGHARGSAIRRILALVTPVVLLVANVGVVSAAAPDNDDVGDARTITALPYTDTVDTSEATSSEMDADCFGDEEHSVWYRYRASATRPTRIAVDADFDATVTVYAGTGGDLEPIACADDPPSLVLDARSGATYHIKLASCCGDPGGEATLRISAVRRPGLDVRLRGGTADTRTGDASIRGAARCNGGRTAHIGVQVRQRTPMGWIASGYDGTTARCRGTMRRWRALVLGDRAFRAGWARVRVFAQVCGGGTCRNDSVTRVIWLSRRPLG